MSEAPATGRTHRTRRRVLSGAVSVAVVAAIFVGVLPRVADLSEVGDRIRDMTGVEVATLLAIGCWNLLTYGFVLVPALPGLTFPQALVVTQSSTAIANTLPAGAGLGVGVSYAMYASWGFEPPAIALSVLVSGIWNLFAKLALPVLALAAVAATGGATLSLALAAGAGVVALVAAVAVFALMLRRESTARRVGDLAGRAWSSLRRLARRPPVAGWGDAAARFRSSTTELIERRWLPLSAGTVISHLSLFAVLLVALRHVGVPEDEVSWAEVLAAYAFVRLLSALPVTPGGLGVVELGLTAALATAGGDREEVVAGVLVYRAITYLLPIPLGAASYVVWRRARGWRQPSSRSTPRSSDTSAATS